MRILPWTLVVALLWVAPARAEEQASLREPTGWKATVTRLEGSERQLWHLALVFHEGVQEVTLVVTPCAQAGSEGAGIEAERIERSASGDLHQIALWAERLRKDAEGWKRPSLRDRPPASAHVIGVVRSVEGKAAVENAEHGGKDLVVGDLLFVEDLLRADASGTLAIELLGKEGVWERRFRAAELIFGAGAKVGLRKGEGDWDVHLHAGDAMGVTHADGIRLHTDAGVPATTYAPGKDAAFLLTRKPTDRLDVRTGQVAVQWGATSTAVGEGAALTLARDAAPTVSVADLARWTELAPKERACTRAEALSLVERIQGSWRGEPRNTMLTLIDDGRWRTYERQPGRSVNQGGSWEPLPGNIVALTYVWTPHRSRTKRTDVYRYLVDGASIRQLVPGGPVLLPHTLR